MNADYRLKTITLFAVVAVLTIGLSGCAAGQAYNRAARADTLRDFDTAMTEYRAALNKSPGNIEIRLKYEQSRFNAALLHFEKGRRAVDKEDYQLAKMEFARVLEIDPTHILAEQQLDKVNA